MARRKKTSPPPVLHLTVPDHADWDHFCVALLTQGQMHGVYRHQADPDLPVFETWPQGRIAILRIGKLDWDQEHKKGPKRGRPTAFSRCWRAIIAGRKEAVEESSGILTRRRGLNSSTVRL